MPSAFAAAELAQALSEVPWGIRSFRLLPDDAAASAEARADIQLLEEGQIVSVACSEGAWRIAASSGRCSKPGKTFDTLDDILLAVSPAFETARMDKLMEKLSAVSNERNGREQEDVEADGETVVGP